MFRLCKERLKSTLNLYCPYLLYGTPCTLGSTYWRAGSKPEVNKWPLKESLSEPSKKFYHGVERKVDVQNHPFGWPRFKKSLNNDDKKCKKKSTVNVLDVKEPISQSKFSQ